MFSVFLFLLLQKTIKFSILLLSLLIFCLFLFSFLPEVCGVCASTVLAYICMCTLVSYKSFPIFFFNFVNQDSLGRMNDVNFYQTFVKYTPRNQPKQSYGNETKLSNGIKCFKGLTSMRLKRVS